MNVTQEEFDALLRTDLRTFIERSFYELNPETEYLPNWHIEKMAEELEKCRRGETKRLIINVPPRSLKSHCVSVAFVAWLLGHNPAEQIIATSYGQDLARQTRPRLSNNHDEFMVSTSFCDTAQLHPACRKRFQNHEKWIPSIGFHRGRRHW